MGNTMSAGDAAKVLKVHQETLRKLIRQGFISATKRYGMWWLKREDVEILREIYNPKPGKRKKQPTDLISEGPDLDKLNQEFYKKYGRFEPVETKDGFVWSTRKVKDD